MSEQQPDLLKTCSSLLADVMAWHADPTDPDYNGCDTRLCRWCSKAKELIVRLKEIESHE